LILSRSATPLPPPWTVDVQPNYCVVRDANGQQIAHVYYSNELDRRSAAKLLMKEEARRIGVNIAKLPTYSANEINPANMASRELIAPYI
jgi:hypothetical protein